MSASRGVSAAVIARILHDKAMESAASEPECRTRFFNTMNKQCAQKREGIYLRLPLLAPGHGVFAKCAWTKEEADRYFANGTLPRDLTTMDQGGTTMPLWIFDARDCGGQLPEVKFERVPDFNKHPALCAFDMDGKEWVALIPSEFLEMVPTGPNKVKFVLNEKKVHEQTQQRKEGKQGEVDKDDQDDGKHEPEAKLAT